MKGTASTSPTGWWLAGLLMRNHDPARSPYWNNLRLIRAGGWRDAFSAATNLGNNDARVGREAFSHPSEFVGITDLVPIYDQFEHGSEILWQELYPDESSPEQPPLEVFDEAHFQSRYGKHAR